MEKGTQKISVVFAFYIEQEWEKATCDRHSLLRNLCICMPPHPPIGHDSSLACEVAPPCAVTVMPGTLLSPHELSDN